MWSFKESDLVGKIKLSLYTRDMFQIDDSMAKALAAEVVDIIKELLNYKGVSPDYHIDTLIKRYEDPIILGNIGWLTEMIYDMFVEVRKRFMENGNDHRLYYKVLHQRFGPFRFYTIVMDLDYTVTILSEVEEKEEISVAEEVSENPSSEMLNEVFDRWQRTAK